MKQYLGLVLILFLSCQNRKDKSVSTKLSIDTIQAIEETIPQTDTTELEEYFADSLNIGRKSFNKVEISKYSTADSNHVIIKFYSNQNGKWDLKNEFQFEKDEIEDWDIKLTDFNNDGLNDLTYISDEAARGANEIRRLFIYDKINDKLIYMKNSENYPNMLYNKDLNCIDAFLVYGGCSTVFLKISGDSLREFASVELFDGLTVTTYNQNGEKKIIFQDTTNKAEYVRYKNFKPLKENDEY